MRTSFKERTKAFPTFVLLAYTLTWLFWIPTAFSGKDFKTTPWLIPVFLGGFGPSVAGIIMVYRREDRTNQRDFWKRVVNVRSITAGWYLFILLVFPLIAALALGFSRLVGDPLSEFSMLSRLASSPLMLIGTVLLGIVTGPLSEELGWRGFALDALQTRWSPLAASLILAPVWWAWHIPLFFIRGSTQFEWGFGTPSFWLFTIGIIPLSVLLTWVYNQNDRSILAAILLHFSYNFTLGLIPLSVSVNLYHVILLFIVSGTVVMAGGNTYKGRVQSS
ncbi:MAG: type II CAAX endopeptidase family protein [Anaerolineales bacterium]|jgi:membrane protease YdiL (CAAX protease family)